LSTWAALLLLPQALLPQVSTSVDAPHPATGARESLAVECAGCHGATRSEPPARFPFGVGKWSQAQCFGCHEEMGDIGSSLLRKGSDDRAFGLPYSFDAMKRFADGKGPFLRAPLTPEWKLGGVERIDAARLSRFLAHPPVRSDGSSMFPAAHAAPAAHAVAAAPRTFDDPSLGKSVAAGKALFEARCATCHATPEDMAGKGPVHLALFSARWLVTYANRQEPQTASRKMPRLPLSAAQGEQLAHYFEWDRKERVEKVDRAYTERLDSFKNKFKEKSAKENSMGGPGTASPVEAFSMDSFLREGRCVHCHDGKHRAAKVFLASREGVIGYLNAKGSSALLARLAVRKIEISQGVVGSFPGMPASAEPLPDTTQTALEGWIQTECNKPGRRVPCLK